jgi:glutathione synthase/RimK-type ligase-like ATP-grasp enzyme
VSRRVAIATCEDLYVDPDTPLLLEVLTSLGIEHELLAWDDPNASWDRFDATVIRSTWDYAPRRDEFLEWATNVPNIYNSFDLVAWNTDKHYLRSLQQAGINVIPSTFADVGIDPIFPTGNFVVKPTVGAGSLDAERYGSGDHARAHAHVRSLHATGRDVIIQPYVTSIDEEGELALVFIDGAFSHAMRKGAMLNAVENDRSQLFRAEQMSLAAASPETLQFAREVLDAGDASSALYARVDLCRLEDSWAVMELELTEPSLFLTYHPEAATELARAILKRLA